MGNSRAQSPDRSWAKQVMGCDRQLLNARGRGVQQLNLLPARAITCKYQNGEVIQLSNRSWCDDHAALIINSKAAGIDAMAVTND